MVLQLPLTAWCSALYLERIKPDILELSSLRSFFSSFFLHHFALLFLKHKIRHPAVKEKGIK